jgi:L-iditol 2-dehydrogenase
MRPTAPSSGADNPAAVLYGVRDLRLEQRPVPRPGPREVLIEIR